MPAERHTCFVTIACRIRTICVRFHRDWATSFAVSWATEEGKLDEAATEAQESAACQSNGPVEDPIQLEIDAKGSLYLPMLIDEVPTLGLMDTGSTISVVHPSILTRLPDDVAVQMSSQVGQIR